MTHRERIKILKELKKWPVSTIDEKLEQVEESLNWESKIWVFSLLFLSPL